MGVLKNKHLEREGLNFGAKKLTKKFKHFGSDVSSGTGSPKHIFRYFRRYSVNHHKKLEVWLRNHSVFIPIFMDWYERLNNSEPVRSANNSDYTSIEERKVA